MSRKFLILLTLGFLLNCGLGYASDFDTLVPIINKGTRTTYYVSGSINGSTSSDFLVDTGSGHSAINEEALANLIKQGAAKFVKKVSATLANGSKVLLPIYKITSINIGGSCIIRNIETVVLPGKTRNILGLNALEKTAPFAISVNPPRLMLSGCDGISA
jgi:predicted aspartyl protease